MDKKMRGDALLQALVNTPVADNKARLETLFLDFVAEATLGQNRYPNSPEVLTSGISDRAVRLGLFCSARDMDDVDWIVLSHPGSIIWAVAVSIGVEKKLSLEEIFDAAALGYRTGATIANFFGKGHRAKWHATSTSGAFAATTTAAVALGLTAEQHINALHICAANIGGSPQAGFERLGAPQTNRAAAISLGIASAHGALLGAPNIKDIWDGPRGLIEMFFVEAENSELLSGVDAVKLRLIDTNGFTHSAVSAAEKIVKQNIGSINSITVVLPASVQAVLDGSRGGPWWNPAHAVAALFESEDPTNLTSATSYLGRTSLEYEDIPIGSGRVCVSAENGTYEEFVDLAPEELIWRDKKWNLAKITNSEEAYKRCSSFPLTALR
jgi:hypothetical protein